MNLKKMSCCMLAVGMIASMNLASFADSTVQAETPLSVEQSASAEQDVKASAYYIDENGNEVPLEIETSVRSLGKQLTRSGEEVENFEVTARATNKHKGDSTTVAQGALLCEATATIYYRSSLTSIDVYAESGTWEHGTRCNVINKGYKLWGAGKTITHTIPNSSNGFSDNTTYTCGYGAVYYETFGTITDSSGAKKDIKVKITVGW